MIKNLFVEARTDLSKGKSVLNPPVHLFPGSDITPVLAIIEEKPQASPGLISIDTDTDIYISFCIYERVASIDDNRYTIGATGRETFQPNSTDLQGVYPYYFLCGIKSTVDWWDWNGNLVPIVFSVNMTITAGEYTPTALAEIINTKLNDTGSWVYSAGYGPSPVLVSGGVLNPDGITRSRSPAAVRCDSYAQMVINGENFQPIFIASTGKSTIPSLPQIQTAGKYYYYYSNATNVIRLTGSSNFGFTYNQEIERFEFVGFTPFYDSNSVQSSAFMCSSNAPANSYFTCLKSNTGHIIRNMQPIQFWEKLGFNNIAEQTQLTRYWFDVTPVWLWDVYDGGQHVTVLDSACTGGQIPGGAILSALSKQSTFNTPAEASGVLNMWWPQENDFTLGGDKCLALIANQVNQSYNSDTPQFITNPLDDIPLFKLSIKSPMVLGELRGENLTPQNISMIVPRTFTSGGKYIIGYADGSLGYQHFGETLILNELEIEITDEDGNDASRLVKSARIFFIVNSTTSQMISPTSRRKN